MTDSNASLLARAPITFTAADGSTQQAPMLLARVGEVETRFVLDTGSDAHVLTTTLTDSISAPRGEPAARLDNTGHRVQEDGGPIAVGGAKLAATLTPHQLIDEYHLFVYPVALGGGKPFFAGRTRVDLETRTFGNRVVYLRYRRA